MCIAFNTLIVSFMQLSTEPLSLMYAKFDNSILYLMSLCEFFSFTYFYIATFDVTWYSHHFVWWGLWEYVSLYYSWSFNSSGCVIDAVAS